MINGENFCSLRDAQIIIDQWRCHYNEEAPAFITRIQTTSALGDGAPAIRVSVSAHSSGPNGTAPSVDLARLKQTFGLEHPMVAVQNSVECCDNNPQRNMIQRTNL